MYRKQFIKLYTENNFSFEEAKSEVDFALSVLFNYGDKDFILGKILELWQVDKLKKIIETRIKTRKPLQQILGRAYFYGRLFFVNEYTLIPRPETELLAQNVLKHVKPNETADVLDIGTGTGCIAITLVLENGNIQVHAVDISDEALNMARKNALFHSAGEKIKFYKSDLFEKVQGKFDIIVSNPPYIPLKDKDTLEQEVMCDPKTALFTSDEDGLEFYKKIIEKCQNYLKKSGFLCFEVGLGQAEAVKKILKSHKYCNIEIIKDFNSIDRIVTAQKNF